MNEQLITICRAFDAAARCGRLHPDDALRFCEEFLPQLIVECEILSIVRSTREPEIAVPVAKPARRRKKVPVAVAMPAKTRKATRRTKKARA